MEAHCGKPWDRDSVNTMKTEPVSPFPTDDSGRWNVPQAFDAVFHWDLDPSRDALLALYEKGKARQWNATTRIDWSQELDPENPQQLPARALPIYEAPFLARMSDIERTEIFRQYQAWTVSQFLHGEQGALICAAKVVQ